MLVNREWSDEQEVFERVAEALDCSGEFRTIAMDERNDYNERGSIIVIIDGRRFSLALREIL